MARNDGQDPWPEVELKLVSGKALGVESVELPTAAALTFPCAEPFMR